MSRRKRPREQVTIGGFVWFSQPPLSDPARERWMASVPGIHVCVSDYGEDDPRGGYFEGWRIVCGAPMKDQFDSRDEAMEAARATIKNEVLFCMAYAREVTERELPFASDIRDRTRRAMRCCEAAGLELT